MTPSPAGVAGYCDSSAARAPSRSARAVREIAACDLRSDDRVMEWRDKHLDAVVGDDLDAAQQMLLGRERRRGRATIGSTRVPVDERVDPGRAGDRARGPHERLASGETGHQAGRTSTSPSSMRFRLATTFENESGGATCSLSV